MANSYISKIKLPSGSTYYFKDEEAREMIAAGITFNIVWTQSDWASSTAPSAEKLATIPAGVKVYYDEGDANATGTLAASAETIAKFYLIYSQTQTSGGSLDKFDEYATLKQGTAPSFTYSWEKIGDTQIDLSNIVTGVTLAKDTDKVLGADTTFSAADSAVTFAGGTDDKVLGADTTFAVSNTAVNVTPTTTYIKATATGAALSTSSDKAITGYSNVTSDTFVKSVSAETDKNLVVTTIKPAGEAASVISGVTDSTQKMVTATVAGFTGSTATNSNSDWLKGVGFASDDAECLVIGAATIDTSDKTFATGALASNGSGADVMIATSTSSTSVATVGSDVTVATGATASDGTGAAVVTGVTIGDSASALTGLGSPDQGDFLTAASVSTQPTIALATSSSSAEGLVSVATGITSAALTSGAITVGSNDEVTAVTGIGTGTAAAQAITVGSNDEVTVLTSDTTITVTKG